MILLVINQSHRIRLADIISPSWRRPTGKVLVSQQNLSQVSKYELACKINSKTEENKLDQIKRKV